MKTLRNHVLIYDNQCPMCKLYSNGFIKSGMMEAEGRKAFAELSTSDIALLDYQRAQNEIALVNTESQEVIYGLDSFIFIIGNSFPFLAKIIRLPFIYWFSKKLYKFVSLNRKQIAPTKVEQSVCVPDFNLKYRLFYILFVALFSAWILTRYSSNLHEFLPLKSGVSVELAICFGQIAWQTVFLKKYLGKRYWDYIGNMMTVSLIGTLLLIPALAIPIFASFHLVYFLLVVMVMFVEHLRRTAILGLSIIPSLSWMGYRCLVLAALIHMN